MMYTYQIIIEYDGSNYVGWQIQKNGISVQEVIEKKIKKLLKKKIIVYGSGRTDAGVHAIGQSAHFRLEKEIKDKFEFLKSLNFFLSKSNISILSIHKRSNSFHSRFSAKKRTYNYFIINRDQPLSLEKKRAWHVRKKLNVKQMKKSLKILIKTNDFSTFRSSKCSAKSPLKTLEQAKILKKNDKILISFTSRSFLHQQVRSMVGCIKYVGENKWSLKKFKEVIKLKERKKCAPPAPPEGLFLFKVKY